MANTTTPASVAARLTDEDLDQFAIMSDSNAYICQYDVIQSDYYQKIAAVLRDYVRLRKLANAVKANVQNCTVCKLRLECPAYGCASSMCRIKNLLAEAEEGAGDGK